MRKTNPNLAVAHTLSMLIPYYAQRGYLVDESYVVQAGEGKHNARETLEHWVDLRAIMTGRIELVRIADLESKMAKRELAQTKKDCRDQKKLKFSLAQVYMRDLKTQQQFLGSAADVQGETIRQQGKLHSYTPKIHTIVQRLFVVNGNRKLVLDFYRASMQMRRGEFHFYMDGHEVTRQEARIFVDRDKYWAKNGQSRTMPADDFEKLGEVDTDEGDKDMPKSRR